MFGLKCIENEVLHSGDPLTWIKEYSRGSASMKNLPDISNDLRPGSDVFSGTAVILGCYAT